MPKVQETKTITADGVPYVVEKMSPQFQQLVVMMDDWRQKEADLTSDLTMVKAALRGLQNDIYAMINRDKAEALEKAKAMKVHSESANDDASEPAEEFVEQTPEKE